MTPDDGTSGGMSHRPAVRTGMVLTGLVVAALAFAIMQTLVIPVLPILREELGTSQEWVTWTVTVYLLVGVVITPLFSRLGDQFGKVRMMLVSLGTFLVGSLGAIAAWNIASLIVWRGVQGVGAAVFPLAFAIIRDHLPEDRWSVAMGTVSSVLGVGGGLGIVAAGLISDNASWRWLFVLSAAIGLAALVLVWRFIPESDVRAASSVDVPGAVLLSLGLGGLLLALAEGNPWGWLSPAILGLFAVSLVTLVVWVMVERRVAMPMVDIDVLTHRPILLTNITAFMSGYALYSTWLLLPTFFQFPSTLPPELHHLATFGFDMSVTTAGLWMLPTSAAIVVGGPIAGMIGERMGPHVPLWIGMVCSAVGSAGIALRHGSALSIALWFSVVGIGIGFAFAAMPRIIVGEVEPTQTAVATGVNNVVRTVGGVMGGQIAAAVVAAHTVGDSIVPAESGYTIAFWSSVGAAVLGILSALAIRWGRHGRPAPATGAA